MSYRTRVVLGLAGGYALGRFRKGRWLLAIAAVLASQRVGSAVAQRGTAALDASPELKKLAEQGRETAKAMVGDRIEGLAGRITATTESLRPAATKAKPEAEPEAGEKAEPEAGEKAEPEAGEKAEPEAGEKAEPEAGEEAEPDGGPEGGEKAEAAGEAAGKQDGGEQAHSEGGKEENREGDKEGNKKAKSKGGKKAAPDKDADRAEQQRDGDEPIGVSGRPGSRKG